ncbi:MAG TPA: hypothetical protein VHM70_22515 [Polyangiaceae bacterium]|jgi:hypothetical protein|nr:hypothetical protein [Polyangiaceae bacterium]
MIKVDEEGAGFSATLAPEEHVLRIVGYGFWSVDLAQRFSPMVRDAMRTAGNVSRLIFDFRDLKPLRDEGQRGFADVLTTLRALPNLHVLVLTSSPLTKLQLLRIVKEASYVGRIDFQ